MDVKKKKRENIGWTYGRFQWGQIGEMAIKSNLIESSRASLCCVGAACNPETWRRHIALSPDLWDSIFNMDSRLRGRKAERSWNDLQRSSVFQTPQLLTTGKGSDDSLLAKSMVYYIISSDMTHTSVHEGTQQTFEAKVNTTIDVPSTNLFYFTMFNRLLCDLWNDHRSGGR